MLTADAEPLNFELRFSNGERLTVELFGRGHEPTSFWRVMDDLQRLARLAPSWDSYGASPLSPSSVRRSFSLLPDLLQDDVPSPAVIPTRDGGLQFEWHRHGVDLEIKVPPAGPIAQFFADANTGEEREWAGPFDRQSMRLAFARMKERS